MLAVNLYQSCISFRASFGGKQRPSPGGDHELTDVLAKLMWPARGLALFVYGRYLYIGSGPSMNCFFSLVSGL